MRLSDSDSAVLEQFGASLTAKGRSKNTVKTYTQLLIEIRTWIGKPLSSVSAEKMSQAIQSKPDWSVSTRSIAVSAAKWFFVFKGASTGTAFQRTPRRTEPTVTIPADQADAFLSALEAKSHGSKTMTRLYATCLLMMRSGLRAGEIVGLRNGDMEQLSGYGMIYAAGRAVYLSAVEQEALLTVEKWPEHMPEPADPFFQSRTGGALDRKDLWRQVGRIALELDTPWITPQSMRNTAIANYIIENEETPSCALDAAKRFDIGEDRVRIIQQEILKRRQN